MIAKHKEKEQARLLRQSGISVRHIAEKLHVAKSSVSGWVRDIVLTEDQKKILQLNNPSYNLAILLTGAKKHQDRTKEKRVLWQKQGRELVKTLNHNYEYIAGCMLFWAEGAKRNDVVNFVNTDVAMMKMFIRFLRKFFHISDEKIAVRIHCYTNNGISISEINNFWLEQLELPSTCLRKGRINQPPKSSKLLRKGKHLYGVCTLNVCSTEIAQKLFGSIQEIAQLDKPMCMDRKRK